MAKIVKPFTIKGKKTTSPKGAALWAKLEKPDTKYNDKGMYSVSLVVDPGDAKVVAYIAELEALRDTALEQANAKGGKVYTPKEVYSQETDKEGNETGNIVFKYKMNNVSDRREGQNKVIVVGPKASEGAIPTIDMGNGSTIRCVAFANPYAMSTKLPPKMKLPDIHEIGLSLILEKVQLIELVVFGGDDDLDDEDGELPEAPTNADGLADEAEAPFDADEENGDF